MICDMVLNCTILCKEVQDLSIIHAADCGDFLEVLPPPENHLRNNN